MLAFRDARNQWRYWRGELVNGVRHPKSVETSWSNAELEAAAGLYRIVDDPIPKDKEVAGWSLEDRAGRPVRVPRLMDITIAALKAYAADVRWRKETGGIEVAGMSVATDRERQGRIAGAHAYLAAQAAINPAATIAWKSPTGFVILDAAQMTAIALAAGLHVQACFAKEAEIIAAIDAGTITTHAEIDKAFEVT